MPLISWAMVLGTLSGATFSTHHNFFIAAAIFLFACIAMLVAIRRRIPLITTAALLIIVISIGFALASLSVENTAKIEPLLGIKGGFVCDGVVSDAPEEREWGGRVDVRIDSCATQGNLPRGVSGKARLTIGRKDVDLSPGERIRFKARFYEAGEYKNPGGFSYRSYLRVHGIGALGKVIGPVERLGIDGRFAKWIEGLRRRIADSAAASIDEPSRGVVIAMANGDQGAIDRGLREVFANTGLSHLLAISGMNVGYVAIFLYLVSRLIFGRFSRLLLRVPLRMIAALVTLPSIWGYVLITGTPISAVRAAIMLTVFLVGLMLWRRQDLLTTLAVSVVAICTLLPLSVFDVSFELSVIAVAGIIIMAPPLLKRMCADADLTTRRGRIWRWTCALISVSLAAAIATAPLVAYHFKFVTGVGIIANLVAVPLTGAFLSPVVAVASGVSLLSHSIAMPIWKMSGVAAGLFIDFARVVADVGRPMFFRWAPSLPDTLLIYAAIAAIVFWKRLPYKKAAAVALSALIMFDAGYARMHSMMNKNIEITILDVGQGDSALVRFPDGRTMLIDGGGIEGSSFDIGRNVVAPALWRMGVHRLDFVLLTHPHHDHYGGLGYIAEQFVPKEIWTNGLEAPDAEIRDWKSFIQRSKDSGVELVAVDEQFTVQNIGGATLKLLNIPRYDGIELNDTTVVADIRYGERRFLFAGDLSERGEARLVQMEPDLKSDFLKVPHHGSADSTSELFLKAVRPEIAAISVGWHNKYGMPGIAAIDRINAAGARILRTDMDGAITIASDGKTLSVETFVK